MLIREDSNGLYIRSALGKDHLPYRPGHFRGHSHAWDTTGAGLQVGDNPKTSHVAGAPFTRIRLPDGKTVYWGSWGRDEGDFFENGPQHKHL
jgi:hypothetical protein